MRPRDPSHEKDDSQDHQAWRGHRCRPADLSVAHRVDDPSTGSHQYKQERSQDLREQSSPL